MKLTIFKHVAVLSGTGVGGGSSVYANTLPIQNLHFSKQVAGVNFTTWKMN
jgi:cholesterol oxidase